MDRAANNAMFALWLSGEVKRILELDASSNSWRLIDKLKLPPKCFLWIEDKDVRRKWHLPYREGAGGIDPETKLYRHAGPVNLNALKAIDQAMGGSRESMPSIIPKEIKSKIIKLLKEFNIGKYSESMRDKEMNIIEMTESSISGQFKEGKFDKENRIISNVILLNSTSSNRYFSGSKGTQFSESFLKGIADNIDGKKVYMNHVSMEEMDKHHGVRDVKDIIGFYENGHMENGVPRADIKYLTHQAPIVESLVGEMADKIGLSIVANGTMSYDKETGIGIAESLKTLHSADLVTEPGSTNNMFESENKIIESEADFMDYKELSIQTILENRPDLVEGLKKGIMDKMSTKEEVDGFKKQIKDLEEANKKQALGLDEYKVKEAAVKRAEKIDELLEESKIDAKLITTVFRETLLDAKDDEAVKKLIEDRKLLAPVKGVKGMGKDKDLDESGEHKLSDEEFEKAVTEAANSRG